MASIQIRSRTQCLIIDFYFKGIRCREQTALVDTPANRKKVQKVLDRLEAEIATGTFDYHQFFPGSKNAAKFDASSESSVVKPLAAQAETAISESTSNHPTFKEFAETWFAEKEVEWRKSHREGTRADLDKLLNCL